MHGEKGGDIPTTTTKAPAPKTERPNPRDPCDCNSGELGPSVNKTNTELWGISCDLYIWAPLAGLCVLLLISLLVTSILLCQRTRRRICRCKHALVDEKNGKTKSPGRYV
ncbi:T-cell surface glycoprotein CD8 alpha chain [Discoglossus pictus]